MANSSASPTPAAGNSSMSGFDAGIELLASILHTYYTPLLVLLGSIGNVLSVYVFYVSKLRMHSTSLYLSVLAISDTIFLIQLLPPWLNAMQITNLFYRPGFCQVNVYSTYASCCCSAWLVVAFTVERFVAVLYPLRRNRMCTVARAKTVIGVLVLGSMVANLPVLKYASPSVNDCNIDMEYMEVAARFNVADTMVSFTLPLGLIMLLNSRIVAKVWRRGRERRAMQAAAAACPHLATPQRALPPMRSQQRVTRMLLVVSSVFVVLNVPAYAMRIAAYSFDMGVAVVSFLFSLFYAACYSAAYIYWKIPDHRNNISRGNTGEYGGRWAALQQLALTFFNTNFGINFILYCLSGQNFRRELCHSVPCLRIFWRRVDDLHLNSLNGGRAGSVTTSYESAHTAGTGFIIQTQPQSRERRHQSEPSVERWTVVDSRPVRAQLQPPAQPHIVRRAHRTPAPEIREMEETMESPGPDVVPTYPVDAQLDEERDRAVAFPLFPFTRLLIPKKKQSSSVGSGTPSM